MINANNQIYEYFINNNCSGRFYVSYKIIKYQINLNVAILC